MTNIIHIVGASGARTTTLGQAFEKEYDYTGLDTDGYFWHGNLPLKREVYQPMMLLGLFCPMLMGNMEIKVIRFNE